MYNEIWKDIVGYEGIYKISSLGKIKSYDRIVDFNKIKALRPSKLLKTRVGKGGYEYTVVSVNKKRETLKIHRMVAIAFIPNLENKLCVNHINGIKTDNRADNLEWVTYSENSIHAVSIGLKKGIKGENSHLSKIKHKDVNKIRELHKQKKFSQARLAKLFNVSQSQISRIVRFKNW